MTVKQQARRRRRIGSIRATKETPPTRHNKYKNNHLSIQIIQENQKGVRLISMMRIIDTENIYVTKKDRVWEVRESLVKFVAKKAGDDEFGDVGSVRTPARGTHG